jgi:hypothetical protein
VRAIVLAAVVAAALAVLGANASADTAPIVNTPDLPWTNPDHQSNLEVFAGQLATHIAGLPVSIRCEGDTDWATLAQQRHFNPLLELGYVQIFNTGGQPTLSTAAELAGGTVCLPLKNFATASAKPTKCTPPPSPAPAKKKAKKVKVSAAPVSCYLGDRKIVSYMTKDYWIAYDDYAQAIETLGHEAVHMSGVFTESVAECSGMQWMPWVAEQLGDTPADAEAVAKYFWDVIYASKKLGAPAYWSAECRPGGALDIRPAGKTDWP